MAKLARNDLLDPGPTKRVKLLLDSPDYGKKAAQLLKEVAALSAMYAGSSFMLDKSWRKRYTSGFKLDITNLATALDNLVGFFKKVALDNPDWLSLVMSPDDAAKLREAPVSTSSGRH